MKSKRRSFLNATKFNTLSLAIISASALSSSPLRAQMTAPSQPAPAAAAGGTPTPETARYLEAFDRADKNTDGKLSKEEAENMPAVAQRFEQIDKDKDGSISKQEYLEALKP
jgi:EF hand